jgi:hypothetical protein
VTLLDTELAVFTRTCEELIADPERLKAVMQGAGITDKNGNLTEHYGGTVVNDTNPPVVEEGV